MEQLGLHWQIQHYMSDSELAYFLNTQQMICQQLYGKTALVIVFLLFGRNGAVLQWLTWYIIIINMKKQLLLGPEANRMQ